MKTTRPASRIASWSVLIVVMLEASTAHAEKPSNDKSAIHQIEVKKGICVVLGDPRCERALGTGQGQRTDALRPSPE